MKRKFGWALPAIFVISTVGSALTAHADLGAAVIGIVENIVVADLEQVLPPALATTLEQITVADVVTLVPSILFNQGESITVGDAEQFSLGVLLNLSETITVNDVIPDNSPPAVTLTATPANPSNANLASFAWTITDPDNNGGFQSFCKLDAGTFVSCNPGIAYAQLSDGLHSFTVNAADPAGNRSADVTYSWLVDTAPPVVACPTPDANWHAADQSFTCTASDAGSGLANPSDTSFTLSTSVPAGTETANASTGTHQVCDLANNCAIAGPLAGIKIDKKPPSISAGAITTGDGQSYLSGTWTNQSVQVTFGCTDGGSGVATVTSPVTSITEGKDQSATGQCVDAVGNTAATSFTNIDIDKTPPTIAFQGQNPPANSYGWNSTSVTLAWGCNDTLSGSVAAIVSTTLTAEGANQSATGTCMDHAGNSASNTQGGISIDTTPPLLSASATTTDGKPYTSGIWTNQNVIVTYHCTDALSGVASVSSPVTISTEGANQTATGTCTDRAGNSAIPATFAGIDIDKSPPITTFSSQPGPLNGRQLVAVTANGTVNPGNITFSATCYDSFGLNVVLSAIDPDDLAGVRAIRWGAALVVGGQPLPNPALGNTITGSSGRLPFTSSGAYLLNYAAVDNAGNQETIQTRWIFVNSLAGIGCATTPVLVSSLPPAGTVSVAGTIQIGPFNVPFAFSFTYPGKA